MKKYFYVLIAFIIFSCEGSDTYQGKWKAMDASQAKFDIDFSSEIFSITDSIGKIKSYKYNQNSFAFKNSTATYGIELEDGRAYKIYFPTSDREVALILDENENQMFTISRKEYINYEDIYKL
jgi:hypothetical protein